MSNSSHRLPGLVGRGLLIVAALSLTGCSAFNQALAGIQGLAASVATATPQPAPTQPATEPTVTPVPPTVTPQPNVRVEFALVSDAVGQLTWAELPIKPARVPGTGLRPTGGTYLDIAFALPGTPPNTALRFDAAGAQPLTFLSPRTTLALEPRPLDTVGRLAWTALSADGVTQALFMGNVDGTGVTQLVGSASPVEVAGWSADGAAVYYAEEPVAAPAELVYPGVSSLFRYDLVTSRIDALVPTDPARVACIDDLAPDGASVVEHCGTVKELVIRYLGGPTTTVQAPPTIPGEAAIGSARFSLDGRRIAFALASTTLPEVISWVAVSDGLGGGATQLLQSQPNERYSVIAWLGPTDLLIQAHLMGCAEACDSLYVLNLDTHNRVKFADGVFVTFSAARPE
ncbi:MAG: hypothetical protein JNL73_11635 [Anaerolineales bacterium]|nr:hypothetical protein [Anaerolineales bacterium]